VALFITCDCGISSAAEIRELKQAGIDCIVTDQHLIPDSGAPDAAIVINPTQSECNFADQGMTGVGIAFYLIIALRRYLREQGMFNSGEISEPNLREYLDLVTLGTIADQAPLIGQNRIFVKNGLPLIANTEKMGLRVLLNLTTPADRQLNVMDIAFSVAPKLNAAGRLGKAQDAFDLLIEDDPIRAAVLARKLVQYNDERRRIEEQQLREVFGEAERFVSAQDLKLGKMPAGLVVYRPHWHLGIVGILSSKLTDRFRCPTIVLSSFGDRIKGSGRSVQGISLIDTLRPCAAHLVTYGGHAMAGGVSLKEENLESFREQWVETLTQQRVGGSENTIATDGLLSIGDISDRLLEEISRLEPFGEGNPEPLFQIEGVLPKQIRRMGDQKQHLRLTLAAGSGATVAAVGFSMGDFAKFNEQIWNVLATPEYNHWQGRRSTQLRLHNIQLIDSLPSAS
jgi:single-stranded-DNA-specific exonuclease